MDLLASGDVVSGIKVGAGILTFQPAASVEILITFSAGWGVAFIGITNGANTAVSYSGYNTSTNYNSVNMKIPINNTNYLHVDTGNADTGYSGIQIK